MVLVQALGTCSTVTSSTIVSLNEATTVAAAYALAGFANADGSSTDIGTSSTNASGLTNAFANALNLVGLERPDPHRHSCRQWHHPQAFINRLSNSLAACVNSNGGTGACTNIAVAPPTGATTATPAKSGRSASTGPSTLETTSPPPSTIRSRPSSSSRT